ncbi:MAG: alpha/beta hydrolase family protein, partial [Pseudomonadota bacterium]
GAYVETKSKGSTSSSSSCWKYEKEFQTTAPNLADALPVEVEMYIPNRNRLGSEKVPMVFILPPIGGVNLLDRRLARTLCANKMAAMIIANDFANVDLQSKKPLLPVSDHQETFYRLHAAIRGLFAFANDDANINPEKVGIVGASLGGILSAFVMSTQPDISAGVFITSGGDIPEILAQSQQDEIEKIRKKRMTEQGFTTKAEYEAFLRQHLFYDPMDMTLTMLPETMQMVIAKRDRNVPTINQEALHKAFKTPKARFLNEGHVSTIISTLFPQRRRQEIANFLESRFSQDNPRKPLFRSLQ